MPPPADTPPLSAYAAFLLSSCSSLPGLQQLLQPEHELSFRPPLRLQDVYVSQDVRQCEGQHAHAGIVAELELSDDVCRLLQESGQLERSEAATTASGKSAQRLLGRGGSLQAARSVQEMLADDSQRLTVILGSPGSGKSSALRAAALRWALLASSPSSSPSSTVEASLPFPILVQLSQYAEAKRASPKLTLQQFITASLAAVHSGLAAAVEPLLQSGDVLLMLDGLNELSDAAQHSAIIGDIAGFVRAQQPAAGARVVVSSRVIGYRPSELSDCGFVHQSLQPFSRQQAADFIARWHSSSSGSYTEAETALRTHRQQRLTDAVARVPAVASLSRSPWLLTLLSVINRGSELPTQKLALYESCSRLLLQRWQLPSPLSSPAGLTLHQRETLMAEVAQTMQAGRGSGLCNALMQDELEAVLRSQLTRLQLPETEQETAIAQTVAALRLQPSALCCLGGSCFAFVHRGLLDYFSARLLHSEWERRRLQETELQSFFQLRAADGSWHEALALTCALLPSSCLSSSLQAVLESRQLQLAVECVEQLRDRQEAADVVSRIRHEFESQHCSIPAYGAVHTDGRSLELLLRVWPDGRTRELLEDGARTNSASAAAFVSAVAAGGWRDERQRALLESVAKSGRGGAREAVAALAEGWSGDGRTRAVLESVASSGKRGAAEAAAALADGWKDSRTWAVLANLLSLVSGSAAFSSLLRPAGARGPAAILAHGWQDDATWALLEQAALSGTEEAREAVLALAEAEGWKDDLRTRRLLESVALSGQFGARAAVSVLASGRWRAEERTRAVLETVARSGKRGMGEAVSALAAQWKDDRTWAVLADALQSAASSDAGFAGLNWSGESRGLMGLLAQGWQDERTWLLLQQAARSGREEARQSISALAEAECWRNDERTRELLMAVARSGETGARDAVLALAASKWKAEESSRLLFEEVARSGREGAAKSATALGRGWRGEERTRLLLEEVAQSGTRGSSEAAAALAEGWRGEETARAVLERIAKAGNKGAAVAVTHLGRGWKDDRTRRLLEDVARSGELGASEAIAALSRGWKRDDRTRLVLEEVARSGKREAREAVALLSELWRREERTRRLLESVAAAATAGSGEAVSMLARDWAGDDSLRSLLESVALSGKEGAREAVAVFAAGRMDDRVWALLERVAKAGGEGGRDALSALSEGWKDDRTWAVLAELVRSGAAAAASTSFPSFLRSGEARGPLFTLAHRWKDDRTWTLLEQVARSGREEARDAVSALAETEGWKDDARTRLLLESVAKSGATGAAEAVRALSTAERWRADERTRVVLEEAAALRPQRRAGGGGRSGGGRAVAQ